MEKIGMRKLVALILGIATITLGVSAVTHLKKSVTIQPANSPVITNKIAQTAPAATTTVTSNTVQVATVKAPATAVLATTAKPVSIAQPTTGSFAGLRPTVLATAMKAYEMEIKKGVVSNKRYLTVIDYSMPSTQPRLWVLDLFNHDVVFCTFVAHGSKSGALYATKFSNSPSSNETSLGVYITGEMYSGKHGASMRLDGVSKGFNDNARNRAIVMHAAAYVSPGTIKSLGYLGRSWGCTAVSPQMVAPITHAIKGGSVLLAYYPNKNLLNTINA
jgi:hypothetical protein